MFSWNAVAEIKNNAQLSIDWYSGSGDVDGWRLGFIPVTLPGDTLVSDSTFFSNAELSLEIAAASWRQSQRDETVSSLIFTPTFRHYFFEHSNISYFWELGIGFALHDANKIERRDFGSFFNFEDHVAVGLKLNDKHSVALRYFHYSNADMHFPNTGIDFIGVNYRMQL